MARYSTTGTKRENMFVCDLDELFKSAMHNVDGV